MGRKGWKIPKVYEINSRASQRKLDATLRSLRNSLELKRKDFEKWTKLGTKYLQNSCCKQCGIIYPYLQYDHIDGNKSNNSPSNCQALCPNCHTIKTMNQKKFGTQNWLSITGIL